MNDTLKQYLQAQLNAVDELEKQIMDIVADNYMIGSGHVKRGPFHTFLYNQLGLHGRYGNNFARFVCKVMQKNGFRVGWRRGKKVIYGLSNK